MRALAFGRTPRYAFAVAALLLISAWQVASAETAAKSTAKVTDPFETIKVDNDPFETTLSDTPVDASAYVPPKARWNARQTNFDATLPSPPQSVTTGPVTPAPVVTKDP